MRYFILSLVLLLGACVTPQDNWMDPQNVTFETTVRDATLQYVGNDREKAYELSMALSKVIRYLDTTQEVKAEDVAKVLRKELNWYALEPNEMVQLVVFVRWVEAYVEEAPSYVRRELVDIRRFLELAKTNAFSNT